MATDDQAHGGGCLCGAIRYRVDGPIQDADHCHCGTCRRASGAVVVSWFSVPRARFSLLAGEPAVYRSSDHGERRFCPTCGTQISFWTSRDPDVVDVTLGSLDRPESVRPDRHVWASSRVPWLHLDEHLPSFAESTPRER